MVRGPHRRVTLPAQLVFDLLQKREQFVRPERSFQHEGAVEKVRLPRRPADRRRFVPRTASDDCDGRVCPQASDRRIQGLLPIPLIGPQTDQADGHRKFAKKVVGTLRLPPVCHGTRSVPATKQKPWGGAVRPATKRAADCRSLRLRSPKPLPAAIVRRPAKLSSHVPTT